MKKILIFSILMSVVLILGIGNAYPQDSTLTEKNKVELFSSFDVTTGYVWRGVMLDSKPNVQPIFGMVYGNFEAGCFNSVSLLNNYYEADLYVAYKVLPFIKVSVTDFFVDIAANSQDYFNYSDTIGYHNVIADLMFGNLEKCPFMVTASTMIYGGLDQDSTGKQKLSSYLELSYVKNSYEFFVGGITGQSNFYMNKDAGILNVGAKIKREIKVSETFSIPVKFALIVNPQMEKLYATLTLSF
jgi:hypothetical protein